MTVKIKKLLVFDSYPVKNLQNVFSRDRTYTYAPCFNNVVHLKNVVYKVFTISYKIGSFSII